MDIEPHHLELVVAALRRAEECSVVNFQYAPTPFRARVVGDTIHVDSSNGAPRIRIRRTKEAGFRIEEQRGVRSGVAWCAVTRDVRLETLLGRWNDKELRRSDLLLSPWKKGEPRLPNRPEEVSVVPEETTPATAEHTRPMEAGEWLAKPSTGPVKVESLRGLARGPVHLGWDGDGEPTKAQVRAARMVFDAERGAWDELLDALLHDSVHHAEGEEPNLAGPGEIPKQVTLQGIQLTAAAREGLAYTSFSFTDGWREEHGLSAVLHGTRVVSVGGYGDHDTANDDGSHAVARRNRDGALDAEDWIEDPFDTSVTLPWKGIRGPFLIRFVYDDETRSDAQRDAARRLVEDGDAIEGAVLGALLDAALKSAPAKALGIERRADLKGIQAREIRVHAEELEGLAYTEVSVVAPWKASPITIVVHGARVVAVTAPSPAMRRGETRLRSFQMRGKNGGPALAAVEAEQEAALAAARAKAAAKRQRRTPSRKSSISAERR